MQSADAGEPWLIDQDTRLEPRVYLAPAGIVIAADGFSLDGNGATIVGGRAGVGLMVRNRRGVQIRNLRLLDFDHGMLIEQSEAITVAQCTVRTSAEMPPGALFLDIFRPAEQPYGGAILLRDVRQSQVIGCDLQHQQNGLLCYHAEGLELRENLLNYCSGAGALLYGVQQSLISANQADFCCRHHARPPGPGHLGADAAGFVIVGGSSHNQFIGNSARMGGDGFFLSGLSHDLVPMPCNYNLFRDNDASYSPNIGFEATFSVGNRFEQNRVVGCTYGYWLSFSQQSEVRGGLISGCRRAGIAAENGTTSTIAELQIEESRYGVLLWSRFYPAFAERYAANETSHSWEIAANQFRGCSAAVRIAANQDHGVRALPADGLRCPPPRQHRLIGNQISSGDTFYEGDPDWAEIIAG